MPSTIGEVDELFVAGTKSVTLTRDGWNAIQKVSKGYFANDLEVGRARRETERVERISRSVWRACKVVAREMRSAMEGKHMAKPRPIALARVRACLEDAGRGAQESEPGKEPGKREAVNKKGANLASCV